MFYFKNATLKTNMKQFEAHQITRSSLNYTPYVVFVVGLLLGGSYGHEIAKSKSTEEVDLGRLKYINKFIYIYIYIYIYINLSPNHIFIYLKICVFYRCSSYQF